MLQEIGITLALCTSPRHQWSILSSVDELQTTES